MLLCITVYSYSHEPNCTTLYLMNIAQGWTVVFTCQGQTLPERLSCDAGLIKVDQVIVITAPIEQAKSCSAGSNHDDCGTCWSGKYEELKPIFLHIVVKFGE